LTPSARLHGCSLNRSRPSFAQGDTRESAEHRRATRRPGSGRWTRRGFTILGPRKRRAVNPGSKPIGAFFLHGLTVVAKKLRRRPRLPHRTRRTGGAPGPERCDQCRDRRPALSQRLYSRLPPSKRCSQARSDVAPGRRTGIGLGAGERFSIGCARP
jgi:hypothetical protein